MRKKFPCLIFFSLPLLTSPLFSDCEIASESLPVPPLSSSISQPKEMNAASVSVNENENFQPFAAKVKGNRVRLRAQPRLEGYVIRETQPGEIFAVVAESNGFYAIRPPKNSKGYIFRTFVLENVVEGERVNVRVTPDMESPVIGQLHRGDKVQSAIAEENNKWLEIALPQSISYFIAKEYLERVGDVEMVNATENKREEALHKLNSAFCFAEVELKKPFEEIQIQAIHDQFATFMNEFGEFTDLVDKAKEANQVIEDTYVQKKISFLECKSDRSIASNGNSFDFKRFHEIQKELRGALPVYGRGSEMPDSLKAQTAAQAAATFTALSSKLTDKMMAWQAVEESLYHSWAANNEGKSIDQYYEEQLANPTLLTGILEPYIRPVKNLPGDYVLKCDNAQMVFLYSTKVNLQDLIGKKVTVISAPRPNHHFAFPAYFVFGVE